MKKIIPVFVITVSLLANIAQAISCPSIPSGPGGSRDLKTEDGFKWSIQTDSSYIDDNIVWPSDISSFSGRNRYSYSHNLEDGMPSCKKKISAHSYIIVTLKPSKKRNDAYEYNCEDPAPGSEVECITNSFKRKTDSGG